ncbi:unnamed protein product, partial [Cuscuta epithymum]
MTSISKFYSSYNPCAGDKKVKVADGSFSAIARMGNVRISSSINLSKVLHVPNLSCNLASVSKLTKELQCCVKFYPSYCVFQDLASGKMIGSAREEDGLYIFDEGTKLNKQGQENACLQTVSLSCNNEVYLMHYRLGHRSFYYLKKLFPQLFHNKNPSSFHCDVCALAKHHKSSYIPHSYKPTSPFTLVHSDIWGASRVSTLKGQRWFITI